MVQRGRETVRMYDIVPEGAALKVDNPLIEAVFEALKGKNGAAAALKTSRQNIDYILKKGWPMRDARVAVMFDRATDERGHRVPAVELLGLAPWQGPDLHSDDPTVRRRARRTREECPRPESNWDLGFRRPS